MNPRSIPFWRHTLSEEDRDAWLGTASGPHLTTGPQTFAVEKRLAQLLHATDVLGTTSCTTALQLALLGMGVGPGDEVVTTPMSFVATANAICHTGATPIFADVHPQTGLLDPEAVAEVITRRTKVLLPVHLYGQMADMEALVTLAKNRGVSILEDSAHTLSSVSSLGPPGTGTAGACLSFYATKPVSAGEGGAFVTSDPALAQRVRTLRLHGLDHSPAHRGKGPYRHYEMVDLGWKANMDDLSAVLLLGQLRDERTEERIAGRRNLHAYYDEHLGGIEGVALPPPLSPLEVPYLYTLRVPAVHRDPLLASLDARGIGIAVNYRPIHLMTYYQERFQFAPGRFPHAEAIGAETLTLPSQGLDEEELSLVCQAVRESAIDLF